MKQNDKMCMLMSTFCWDKETELTRA